MIRNRFKEGNLYLRADEQDKVIQSLRVVQSKAKPSEIPFLSYTDYISVSPTLMQSYFYWRASFRGFNLFKYAKHRLTTLLVVATCTANATLLHQYMTTAKLYEYFRSEEPMHYGIRSMSAHLIGSATVFAVTTGVSYCIAQRAGFIPLPDHYLAKGVPTLVAKYVMTKLKPFSKGMLFSTLAGCSFMFLVGIAEFRETQNLLALINRKTTSLRES